MKLELKKLVETLDIESKNYLQNGASRCISRQGSEIIIEDILYVMLENRSSLFNRLLEHYSIPYEEMLKALQTGVKSTVSESSSPVFSPILISWLEDAFVFAKLDKEGSVINETILLSTLIHHSIKYSNTPYFKLLESIDTKEALELLDGKLAEANSQNTTNQNDSKRPVHSQEDLQKYTIDLTALAESGKIDPVLCRDEEIRQTIDILLRRRKNNPILVGEAGVGKTAVVEGLALRIVQKKVPIQLYNTEVLSLDLGALQAGASVKGEFERRLQSVINAIKSSTKSIILFIDEAHTLIGAGGNEGGSDAANLLKPALARGELRTVAATTWLEYRKYFEKDPALSRRFQKINVLEPSVEDTVTILRGIAHKYEQEHNVYIEDGAMVAAASLSARYITARQLPDKAIDILDTACANVKISQTNEPHKLTILFTKQEQINNEIEFLQRDIKNGLKDYSKRIKALNNDLKQIQKDIENIQNSYKKQKAILAEIIKARLDSDTKTIETKHKELMKLQKDDCLVFEHVSSEQVSQVVSSWTGIPLGSMVQEHTKNLLEFPKLLKERVIGQDQAIDYLNTFLQISMAGLKNENAPTGVFLLVGPSGVGKTETARAIADLMYGGEQFITTINMTEFQEKHTLSRLIGSPPGYVGYGEGGQLTDPVRIKPYSVVLFDEIEKAHPDILNIFYQIFDRGVVSDGEGRSIDFKNTILIMTSNLATQEITNICTQYENIELGGLTKAILPILGQHLKPALLGRMSIVPYMNLEEDSLKKIAKIKLKRIENQLAQKEITLKYDDALLNHIVTLSDAVDTGARNIELIINTNIIPEVAKVILQSAVEKKIIKTVRITINNNGDVVIKPTEK